MENKKFEEAIKELEEVVTKLEKGELTLEESIEYFQKGVELTKYCTKRLDETERRITLLIEKEDGTVNEESLPV